MERLKRDHARQLIAGALVAAALVILIIGYANIRDEIQVAAQMPYVLTGGVGALILTGLGVTELSMSLPSIAAVKASMRRYSSTQAKAFARKALACATARAVRQLPLP